MGADSSALNIPNAPEFIGPICLPKPKSFEFLKKSSLWMSVVRGISKSQIFIWDWDLNLNLNLGRKELGI